MPITRLPTFLAASMDLRIAVADSYIRAYKFKVINFVPVYVYRFVYENNIVLSEYVWCSLASSIILVSTGWR